MTDDATAALQRAAVTIQRLRVRLAEATGPAAGTAPIAVIATACRFPGGADSPEAFWELLSHGRDAVRPIPSGRWTGVDFSAFGGRAGEQPYGAGILDDVELFDAGFFGIKARDAAVMDPQQRMTLEVCWEALERAGIPIDPLRPSQIGVFVGAGHQDYLMTVLAGGGGAGSQVGAGNARSIIANRVSYHLGLTGPSLTVDTACSSSLTAIHLAGQSLAAGECDIALAGGVNLILSPLSTLVTGAGLPLAPDSRTKTFDRAADGMVRGEGCGMVVLRPLPDAIAAQDDILAVIMASASNNDGRSNGLTAPSPSAQQRLLTTALAKAGLTAADLTLLELHGTGTPLGDAIEVEAAAAVHAPAAQAERCWLSSVKPNIGHLESAAGVASFIKVVEAIRHGRIPPQIHVRSISPDLHLDRTRFAVAHRLENWKPGGPRRAGISSFGFGGANVHVIVAQPPPPTPTRHSFPVHLVPVSARSAAALRAAARQLAVALAERPDADLGAFAAAVARRRSALPYRAVVEGPGRLALIAALNALADSPDPTASPAGPGSGEYADLARQWLAGAAVDWSVVYPGTVPAVGLPTYPWQKQAHWFVAEGGDEAGPRGAHTLLDRIRGHVADALGDVRPDDLDPDVPARDLGVDSMVLVDLKSRFEHELGISVPITALIDGASLRQIATRLAGSVVPGAQTARELLDDLDELSEAELDAILARRAATGGVSP